MPIKIREVNNISILDIEGRIDINSSDIIETVGWLVNTGKVNIILNFENVDLVDYNGISILVIAYKNIINHKGRMKLLRVALHTQELFKIVKLETVFETYADEEAAVNSFYSEEVERLHLRRKYQRLDIKINVKYKIVSSEKTPKVFNGKALNLSAAGLYIYSPYTFPINTMLDLEFGLSDVSATIETLGKVVYLADKEIQPHSYPGMGVSFVHLTADKENAIIGFVDKNITHRAEPI